MHFGILQYVQCILYVLTNVFFVSHLSLLTAKDVDLAVTRDGFPS